MTVMVWPLSRQDNEIEALENVIADLRKRSRAQQTNLPHLVRTAQRMLTDINARAGIFDPRQHLFGDPALAIMLYVFQAQQSHRQASVTDAANASGAAPTTGLRYITKLTEAGYIERTPDILDRRRSFLGLSGRGSTLMHEYLIKSVWI